MNQNDWTASDSLRMAAKALGPNHPDHPRNIAARAAEAARKAAEAAAAASSANASPSAEATPAPEVQPVDTFEPAPTPKKRRKRRNRRRQMVQVELNETARDRHERLCTICNHENHETIDEEFVNWLAPEGIADFYDVDWRAVYRHAHATGLFAARERNLRAALGQIVEQAASVTPTIDGVLRAIRAYSCLNREGHWTELPSHVVVSSGSQLAQANVIAESALTLDVASTGQQEPQEPSDG